MKLQVDISKIGLSNFTGPDGQFDVDVFDSASDYVKLMKYVSRWDCIKIIFPLSICYMIPLKGRDWCKIGFDTSY